jgi:hypothetical protein
MIQSEYQEAKNPHHQNSVEMSFFQIIQIFFFTIWPEHQKVQNQNKVITGKLIQSQSIKSQNIEMCVFGCFGYQWFRLCQTEFKALRLSRKFQRSDQQI